MKILYLCADGGIDVSGLKGGSIHVRALVRALAELGHQVTLVSTRVGSPRSLETDVQAAVRPAPLTAWNQTLAHVIRAGNRLLGRPARNNPDLVRALHNLRFSEAARAAARELAPDFIYERYTLWGVSGLRLAKALCVPLVLEVNAPLAEEQQRYRAGVTCPPLARWVERKIWRRANLLVSVSEPLRAHLERAGVSPESVRVLPNAVDTRVFRADLDPEPVRRRFNLEGRFVAGFVGTFKRWHGVDWLLAAFQDFYRTEPSAHLLLVGDGPLRPLLEEQARKAGLGAAVTFAGSVAHDEIPQYLAAMDVALAPYPALEAFYYSPLKLFEYMAAGRAVVASRVGQVAEVVKDGVTGLLFEPGDRAGLVERLGRLQKDATLRRDLGRRASLACSKRTWNQNAAQVIDWVGPLLGPKQLVALSA
jgi:glycosyltransferase involved in cell wall biosynthesis